MEVLNKLAKLEKEASAFGFKWENAEQIIAQIQSELKEIAVHLHSEPNDQKLQEEIGDLLHAAFSLCIFCQFDAEKTLENTVSKFEKRFRATQVFAQNEGLTDLHGQPFAKLMALWDKAKAATGK